MEEADCYCICLGPETDDMFICQNEECEISFYHRKCKCTGLNSKELSNLDEDKWICKRCKKTEKENESKRLFQYYN